MISEMNLGGHSMGIMLMLGKGEEKVGQRVGVKGFLHRPCWEIVREDQRGKLKSISSKTACQYMEQLERSYTAAGNAKRYGHFGKRLGSFL